MVVEEMLVSEDEIEENYFILCTFGVARCAFFSTENYIISIKQNPKEGSRAPSRVETPSPSVAGLGPWGPVGSRQVGVSAPGTEPVRRKHQECTVTPPIPPAAGWVTPASPLLFPGGTTVFFWK